MDVATVMGDTFTLLSSEMGISNHRERKPSVSKLSAVIESLYADQLVPSIADILRRFAEKYPSEETLSEIDLLALASTSETFLISGVRACPVIIGLASPGVQFTGWVDPSESDYVYSDQIWVGLKHFVTCAMLDTSYVHASNITGGRYHVAKFIKDYAGGTCVYCDEFSKNVSDYTLGRLCHLVQASINCGILRYEANALLPAAICPSITQVLLSKLSLLPLTHNLTEIQSIEELELCLEGLLTKTHQPMDLSQLKKLLIREYEKILNPRRLGFIKVSEIFSVSKKYKLVTIQNTVLIQSLF